MKELGAGMYHLSDSELIEAYQFTKAFYLDKDFIIQLEKEIKRRGL